MQIAENTVVSIDYTLTDEDGQVLDSSKGGAPLDYLHGAGNLIPGLESALAGKDVGEEVEVSLPPEQGYGEVDPDLVASVSRDRFQGVDRIEVGMQFQANTEAGPRVVRIVEVADDEITVDANHPLAGKTLNFNVSVVHVRAATPEEISHGHVHGPDGHHHH